MPCVKGQKAVPSLPTSSISLVHCSTLTDVQGNGRLLAAVLPSLLIAHIAALKVCARLTAVLCMCCMQLYVHNTAVACKHCIVCVVHLMSHSVLQGRDAAWCAESDVW